jgi:hypothetical protein
MLRTILTAQMERRCWHLKLQCRMHRMPEDRPEDSDPPDRPYVVGTTNGIDTFTELHELGLFTHHEYRRAFMDAGLTVEHDPVGLFNRGLYIRIRPTGASQ